MISPGSPCCVGRPVLRAARELRDEARSLVARGINPRTERKQKRQAIKLAGENTFMAVYEKWMEHRQLTLEDGRQSSLEQIRRVFKKDVFPYLKRLTIYEVTRPHLLEVVGRIEKRNSLSVAEKVRTWLKQLFDYAMVVIPAMETNPATDLHVVAVPLPPVEHNPFLRMAELPGFLQTLRKYRGMLKTQLAIRLLLLTGVRTGELRLATPDQFDLDRGLWIIPVMSLKQRKMLTRKKRKRVTDIPPYIVPLSVQAMEIVRYMLDDFKPAQKYLFAGVKRISDRMSENTVNVALKRLGYDDRLTGHGIRATIQARHLVYVPGALHIEGSRAERVRALHQFADAVAEFVVGKGRNVNRFTRLDLRGHGPEFVWRNNGRLGLDAEDFRSHRVDLVDAES